MAEQDGSRRSTRSQAAPDWTSKETLTLVTEITAVERDYGKTFSSFQKWKTVSENCAALEVNRSLDQCRRKWDSLLSIYNKVKELGSYWNLDDEARTELGVSEDFDLEVFKAMDEHLKKEEEEGSEMDPEVDPEAEVNEEDEEDEDVLVDESGFEKQCHKIMRKKRSAVEVVKPQKQKAGKKMKPQTIIVEEKVNLSKEEKTILMDYHSTEDIGQVLASKLLENAELIDTIVKGKMNESDNFLLADMKNVEATHTDFIRHQGDQLIACLGNLAHTLEQLFDFVGECN